MVILWDVKRSLSMSIFLVHNTFIMLVRYGGVRLNLVEVEAILKNMHTTIKRGAIIEYDSTASRYNFV
ncbi:hypothetical protein NC651_009941 [Populus alba x Populus x berolinensis]|nr:hypothetical protein NC651_009941 [Populus alba x Populus x berolinensis]